ncbi:hypothetical protein R1flu_024845 [Riccia fluitans]|uniref:Uncharacterized protein n=1 Tax=Riccia fluitans TaxID=41844 RepID=A0ABD1Y055_9MARC
MTSHLTYECRNSQNCWQLLRENTRTTHPHFYNARGLLALVIVAIRAKDGNSFVFIFHSLTNTIWKDRNLVLFKNKQRNTPLLVTLDRARAELEGSMNGAALDSRWQQAQKAMEELNSLIKHMTDNPPQRTRDPTTYNDEYPGAATRVVQAQSPCENRQQNERLENGTASLQPGHPQ